ncbi:MAG: hypothetical protein GY749_02990 [Desulfobacteraceae bacterium]|nr:hypothetical protein [Desulfobacteraceae bacterium]
MNNVLIWKGPNGADLPAAANSVDVIIPFAYGLNIKQQKQVVRAFEDQAYDMGAEYIWRKSMIRLRNTLKSLGMKFIGELLEREDVDEFSNIETILTDYNTITLAEQLGVINTTGSLKLKHSLEIITHFFSEKAEKEQEELSFIDGVQIISTCVKYILGEQDISIATDFSKFRTRLLSESLSLDDPQIQQLVGSPPFYHKTVLSVLLSSIKNYQGAVLEHALGNLNLLIKELWAQLSEKDRWAIGTAYRDVTSDGNIKAIRGLKTALLKISGFDYVPENLRSMTYKKVARAIIEAHFSFNSFYTEVPLVNTLAKLGSTIPSPALIDCIQAYLCVYLGNSWSYSYDAAPKAEECLKEISKDRWLYYLRKVIHNDDIILVKLMKIDHAVTRFSDLLQSNLDTNDLEDLSGMNLTLARALLKKQQQKIKSVAEQMFNKLKGR